MALWFIPLGLGAAYVAKKIYNAVTDDNSNSSSERYSDNSAEREHETRQAAKEQDEQSSRQRKHEALEKDISASLKDIRARFLDHQSNNFYNPLGVTDAVGALSLFSSALQPTTFAQSTLDAFAEQDIDTIEDAERALSVLCSKTFTLKELPSEQAQQYQAELNGLNQLAKLLHKV